MGLIRSADHSECRILIRIVSTDCLNLVRDEKWWGMSKLHSNKLKSLTRLNRRVTINPLLRTRLIWFTRVWLVDVLDLILSVFKSVIKFVFKSILIFISAMLLF